jgi:hypothetical protein
MKGSYVALRPPLMPLVRYREFVVWNERCGAGVPLARLCSSSVEQNIGSTRLMAHEACMMSSQLRNAEILTCNYCIHALMNVWVVCVALSHEPNDCGKWNDVLPGSSSYRISSKASTDAAAVVQGPKLVPYSTTALPWWFF